MTASIFEEFLLYFDRILKSENRKIALILDRCRCHKIISLDNIELVFLPPNSTAINQPLDAGIIKSFKDHYKKQIIRLVIEAHNNCRMNTNLKELLDLDLFKAIQFAIHAWNSVSPESIKKIFLKCMPETADAFAGMGDAEEFFNAEDFHSDFDSSNVEDSDNDHEIQTPPLGFDEAFEGISFNDIMNIDNDLITNDDSENNVKESIIDLYKEALEINNPLECEEIANSGLKSSEISINAALESLRNIYFCYSSKQLDDQEECKFILNYIDKLELRKWKSRSQSTLKLPKITKSNDHSH